MKSRSRWPLAIGVSLSVVFAVNMAFLALAVWSDDGLVDNNYYEKGLKYGERLKEARELGWSLRLIAEDNGAGIKEVTVALLDRDGRALNGAKVAILVMRPAKGGFDVVHELKNDAGLYKGRIALPLDGWWDFKVTATVDNGSVEKTFRLKA
ncbi:MAG: FixH family protein [Deltaproteobacteria bacterium]|nr:FixH family protein [Deltaproteobacteria bacterium]